jgi:hypothetical protein
LASTSAAATGARAGFVDVFNEDRLAMRDLISAALRLTGEISTVLVKLSIDEYDISH